MATEKQRQAARDNGAKSHGPATPEGRDISKYNALQHGLTARMICLTTEDSAEFKETLERLIVSLDPQDQIQMECVADIAVSRWHLNRAVGFETALIDLEIIRGRPAATAEFGERLDPDARGAIAFDKSVNKSGSLALLHRYRVHLRRTWEKALALLLSLKASGVVIPSSPSVTRLPRKPVLRNEPAVAQPKKNQRAGRVTTPSPAPA